MASICLINGVYPPQVYGGAENYVVRVASALRDRGHDAKVLTTEPYDDTESLKISSDTQDGIPVFRFYPANVSHRSEGTGGNIFSKAVWHQLDTINPHAKRVVSNFLDREEPDVVHTNNFMGISTGIGRAVTESDARYVHMLHDFSLVCPKSNLLRERTLPGDEIGVCEDPPTPCKMYGRAKQFAIGKPDLVVGPSQRVIDVHREHGFFEDCPTRRVFHGITDISDAPPAEEPDSSVLYVGKHLRAKGLETIFSAAAALPEVTFHLCGTGPYDTETTDAAERLPNVEYHGYVSEERLEELRRSVAAAVVPSRWMENSPLVVYESFARGLPVIAADIGGLPELVASDRGTLFESGDADALSRAISRLLDDPAAHERMSEAALAWAREHTMPTHVDNLLDCYNC